EEDRRGEEVAIADERHTSTSRLPSLFTVMPIPRRRESRGLGVGLVVLGGFVLAACAPKAPALPAGPGSPFGDYAAAYEQATAACSGVKTITASMALSGKAGT